VKIPDNAGERAEFVKHVVSICQASQQTRQQSYRTLKQYYLYGDQLGATGVASDVQGYGTVNKIWNHIDKTCSMLYSPDTVRFGVEIARNVSRDELRYAPILTDAVMDTWHQSETDTRVGEAVRWALVYGTMHIKARPIKQDLATDLIEPHHFGVYREDICGLHNQEAFFHEYRITKSQLEYQLRVAGFKDYKAVVDAAIENAGDEQQQTQGVNQVITTTALPSAQGEYNTSIGAQLSYVATVKQPLVRMYELYVFDDEIGDLRIFTVAHPFVPIYDRPIADTFLEHDQPFVQICPFPMHGYYWGMSAVERLIVLQQLRNTRWEQVQHLMTLQAQPPTFVSGDMNGDPLEIQAAFDSPTGLVTSVNGSKADRMAPAMPEDLFAEVNYLDTQFDDAVGTSDVMSGKGEPGVRSEGHAAQLMRAGSSRAKARALIIERQIEELATLILKIMRKYSDRVYKLEAEGNQPAIDFVAKQFTDEFMVHVDAHSSSPIFMIDMANMAFALFKAKAIDRATLIDMLNVPMRNLLKQKLKTNIEPAEKAAAQRQEQLELATGKVSKIGSKK